MKAKFLFLTAALVFVLTTFSNAQLSETEQTWNQPVEPFRIAGNIYYVGASDVTSYLITTPKGHILLDSGLYETVPQIKENVAKLGFKFSDIKILINSHAHYDHAGGLAELKKETGAKLYASRPDAKLLERGGKNDPNFGDRFPFAPVKADKTFSDGWKLKHGGANLKALVTAGHTKGCTTWTTTVREAGRDLNVIFVCSTTAPGYKLVGNKPYPNIVSDYEKTFRRMKDLRIDVFLSSHATSFRMAEKAEIALRGPETNPFIDPAGYMQYVISTETAFRKLLEQQSPR